jgi:hypothetical protein
MTSPIVTPTIGRSTCTRPAASIASVNSGPVQPTVSASVCQRSARSATPCPVFLWRVSLAASRSNAACSKRVGVRPSRSMNSSILSASASLISTLRFENVCNSSVGTPAISACPFTISPQATPNRAVSSERSSY